MRIVWQNNNSYSNFLYNSILIFQKKLIFSFSSKSTMYDNVNEYMHEIISSILGKHVSKNLGISKSSFALDSRGFD